MEPCEHCGQPKDLHMGFDHQAGKCLLAATYLDLTLKFGPGRARAVLEEARHRHDRGGAEGAAG